MGVATHLGIDLREYDQRIRTFIPDYEEIAGYDYYNEAHEGADIVRRAAEHEPHFKPGARFEYSNTGYYLLGMNKLQLDLFRDKTWSTDSVLAETLADAHRLGLRVALLPELRDLDTAADLAAWNTGHPALEGMAGI